MLSFDRFRELYPNANEDDYEEYRMEQEDMEDGMADYDDEED